MVSAPPASVHQAVLLAAVLDALQVRPGGTYLDCTVGGGGHAAALLAGAAPGGRLLGLDRDPSALARAGAALASHPGRAVLAHGSFADLAELATAHGFSAFDGILLDLGISSDQLATAERGFSFQHDGPLDMRLDPEAPLSAAELVNDLSVTELADILYELGEERHARRIARAIVAARPVTTTVQLAAVVAAAMPGGGRSQSIHPATRTFQALRLVVNDELGALAAALPQAIQRLAPRGRLAVISFHSLEDRLVKQAFRAAAAHCICPPGLPACRCDHQPTVSLVTRRPIVPDRDEIATNPRARSAKLRVAERLHP